MPKKDVDKIISYLKQHLSKARFNHTLGTWRVARQLASKHKVSRDKIDIACLLHDAGKGLKNRQLIKYVKKAKMYLPYLKEIIKNNPSILHSFVSADIARKKFGVRDKEILKAISSHTIGSPCMNTLDKIVYLADITAPDRRYPLVKRLRWHASRDLDKAMRMALKNKIQHVIKNKKWLHPGAVESWNSFVAPNVSKL
ncbi:MAG: bis(5'-nucleosyl)-tetraphosphatase (symmetrical) YqeK [Endomicrobiales bacterium]|nr:bis(5'-nucleosyl)-tetraphosphatase (symmetrical) YqeK [Endomicrobiales bacterium]